MSLTSGWSGGGRSCTGSRSCGANEIVRVVIVLDDGHGNIPGGKDPARHWSHLFHSGKDFRPQLGRDYRPSHGRKMRHLIAAEFRGDFVQDFVFFPWIEGHMLHRRAGLVSSNQDAVLQINWRLALGIERMPGNEAWATGAFHPDDWWMMVLLSYNEAIGS